MSVLPDPTALLRKAKRRAAIMLLSVGVGVAAAYGVTTMIPPTYEAAGSVLLTGGAARDPFTGQLIDVGFAGELVPTVARLAESREVALAAAADAEVPATEVIGRIKTEYQQDAQIVTVEARAGTAREAATIANAVVHELSDQVRQRKIDGTGSVGAQPLDRAMPPTDPILPNLLLDCTLGGVLGLIAGLGLARLRDQLDDKVRDVDDLRDVTGVPALASIPFTRRAADKPLASQLPGSGWPEAFGQLRTNLEFISVDTRPQIFAITSAAIGDGKSITSCNLAIALANAGRRVLLVEADLRRPACSRYLGVRGSLGLTTVLGGQTEFEEAIQPWGENGLMFLPAGPPVPNPSELLASHRVPGILRAMRDRFDVILVDLPSLLPIPDAAVLAGQVDGVLLLARHRHTRGKQIRKAVEALNRVNARLLGCVLTMTPPRQENYGYAYTIEETHDREITFSTSPNAPTTSMR